MNRSTPWLAAYVSIAMLLAIIPVRADFPTGQSLVDALASDDIPWNADRAQDVLWGSESPPLEALHKALDSDDYQQRQFAADMLRYKDTSTPSQRLLEVTVEGLCNDHFPAGPTAYNHLYNAERGAPFVVKHGRRAKDFLLAALDSDDYQQRFLCAYALGMNRIRDRLEDCAAILIFHLQDNNVPHDASMACAALYRLGPRVRPLLLEALKDADEQETEAIHLILLDLKSPPKNKRELVQRKSMQHFSPLVYDPAIEYDEPWAGGFPSQVFIKKNLGTNTSKNKSRPRGNPQR